MNNIKKTKNIKLKIVQWNCRSLGPKLCELESYLTRESIHICVCSETWLSADRKISMSGFYCVRRDREDEYGGVAIFIHNSIRAKLVTTAIPNCQLEHICIELKNFDKIKYIIGVYSSQNINVRRIDYESLFGYCSRNTLITGDFNGHHTAWSYKTDTRGSLIAEISADNNFIYLNNGNPTRFAMLSGETVFSTPDITFASSEIVLHLDWSVSNECLGSDHRLVVIEMQDSYKYFYSNNKRNLKTADWSLYKQELSSLCSDFMLNDDL
jgi:hypothetical protein